MENENQTQTTQDQTAAAPPPVATETSAGPAPGQPLDDAAAEAAAKEAPVEKTQAEKDADDCRHATGFTYGEIRTFAKKSGSFTDLFREMGYHYRPCQSVREHIAAILGPIETSRLKGSRS